MASSNYLNKCSFVKRLRVKKICKLDCTVVLPFDVNNQVLYLRRSVLFACECIMMSNSADELHSKGLWISVEKFADHCFVLLLLK